MPVGGSTFCLDANGKGTTNGTEVIIWSCKGQSNQLWNLNGNGKGKGNGAQPGLCLDVTGGSIADGAWSSCGPATAAEQWHLG